MAEPIRLFIIDDHADVRRALVAKLSGIRAILVVGETGEADTGMRELQAIHPDVVLVEMKRTDGRGLEIVSGIARNGLAQRVIVLTSYPSDWERWAAHRAGAVDYLLKDIDSTVLVDRIRAVAAV